jgi:hypothetical protein
MRNSIFVSVAAVAVAAANPVMMTFINEFGFYDDSLGWVELHVEPGGDELNLNGWLLTTNTSACTFAFTIPYGGFLVVDSASLAGGTYAHGTFRLNPAGDHIQLLPDSAYKIGDSVVFPVLPAGRGRAPMPPYLGSAALLNLAGADQLITWYIDSTPTAGQDNDDYSSVTGTVTWAPSRNFYLVEVSVHGPMGGSLSGVVASGQSYVASGLSAGRYTVSARGQPGNVIVSYPESVDVGYSEILPGINLEFDPDAVAESFEPQTIGRKLEATVIRSLPQGAVAFDAMGRRVVNPRAGILFVRQASSVKHGASSVTKVVIQH